MKTWRTLVAAAFAVVLSCGVAQAQRFDSSWRRIAADALTDLDLSGGDVRVNNLIVSPENEARVRQQPDQLSVFVFSLSTVKRAGGARSAFVEIVGMDAQHTPTIVSIIVVNFGDTEVNRLRTDSHRFPALPRDVAATTEYFVRILVQ